MSKELVVKKIVRETKDAVTLFFENPGSEEWKYKSGQFLTLIASIDGKEARRSYSLCSTDGIDSELAVTVKRVTGGLMSNYLLDSIKEGDSIVVDVPMGNFVLEPQTQDQRHVVLIGGGSGITPLMSMLKTVLKKEEQSVVSLVFANSTKDSIIFKDQLEGLHEEYKERFRLYNYLSKATRAVNKKGFLGIGKKVVTQEQGRLDDKKLAAILDGLYIENSDHTQYYICGPEGLMEVAEKTLKNRSIDTKNVFKEHFVLKAAKETNLPEGTRSVNVVVDGVTSQVEVKKQSILFSAIDQGIDVPYSCQSGICTACMAKCTSGEVKMEFEDALTDEQIAEGYVLTCIGYPMSDDVTVEYE